MENKKFGYLLLGVSVVMGAIVYMFNHALEKIVNASCSLAGHGDSCPMTHTINEQTTLSLFLVGLVVLIAVYLIVSKPEKEIVVQTKKVKERVKKRTYDLSGLKAEEKDVFEYVKKEKAVFQADLIEQLNISKAKMTRILDRLEGRGFIDRKRRGLTNVVVLKD